MTTRTLIDIANHPDLDNVTRKVRVKKSNNDYDNNAVILEIAVLHYINGVEITYFPSDVYLKADNNIMVNSTTGEEVEKDEEGNYPVGSIGEFDYLWNAVNVRKIATQKELEEFYIPHRVSKINKKLYTTKFQG